MNDEYIKVLKIETTQQMNSFYKDLIDEKISSMEGVKLHQWTPEYFKITYYPQVHVVPDLINEFEKIGIKTRKPKKKGWFGKLLSSIAKENKKSFGDHKLDCCDLNKD